jgi:hypothetical protein
MGTAITVAELARLLHPRDAVWRVMVMLRAHFDASFTEEIPEGVTAIGGFIGSEDEWTKVEAAWVKNLAYWKQPDFHLAEMPERMGRTKAEDCSRTFAKIAGDHDITPLWGAVLDHAWNAVRKPPAFLALYPTAYHLCVAEVLYQVSGWLLRKRINELAALVFDDDVKPRSAVDAIFETYKSNSGYEHFYGSITFASRRLCRALQAADLIAGQMRLEFLDEYYPRADDDSWPFGRRWVTEIATPKGSRGGCYHTKETIERAVANFVERGDIFRFPPRRPSSAEQLS